MLCCSVDSVEEEVQAELKQLMDEVWVLGSLSHPSITRFCALCLDPPMIVMQYYPHGSLFDLLKRGRRADRRALHELTWAKRWVCALFLPVHVADRVACASQQAKCFGLRWWCPWWPKQELLSTWQGCSGAAQQAVKRPLPDTAA